MDGHELSVTSVVVVMVLVEVVLVVVVRSGRFAVMLPARCAVRRRVAIRLVVLRRRGIAALLRDRVRDNRIAEARPVGRRRSVRLVAPALGVASVWRLVVAVVDRGQ